jgi:hypothetical protein
MLGFDLPENFIDDLESLLRKRQSHTASSSYTPPTAKLVTPAPYATPAKAKILRDYSVPAVANVPVGPTIITSIRNFELKTGLITMV